MKDMVKLIRRFALILVLSLVGLVTVNILLVLIASVRSVSNGGGWTDTRTLSGALTQSDTGEWVLSAEGQEILDRRKAWAILIENGTGDVIWHSDNLPEEIPLHYTAAEISWYTRGYVADYPTTTASRGDDLLMVGHPKDQYWKEMTPTWDYHLIAGMPRLLGIGLLVNLFFVILIYVLSTFGMLRQIRPLAAGIERLPEGEAVYIKERGLLSQMSSAVNRASEKLRMQARALEKKERARADWISGVSHDIRTPLSMVMGYAGQLEEDPSLSADQRKKARMIRLQSVRMKNLVNDLNLSSKLEYHMQPLRLETVNLVSIVRQAAVDFMNTDLDEKYPVSWDTEEALSTCVIRGDKNLLLRAVQNLLTNAQVHNPDGCHISVCVRREGDKAHIRIADDGVGVTEEQLEKLRQPHYAMSDGSTKELRHGMGLLIVRQIAAVHQGTVTFEGGLRGGFVAELSFMQENQEK